MGMPRKPRRDEPGAWHHVGNRGLAKRAFFEKESDVRYFLSRLARTIRAGALEVHAFTLLTTHYHLMVRSPRGELSGAMQWVQNQYVRMFNRRYRRDGPLVRQRFWSNRVRSDAYRHKLVRYLDLNPVVAGIVDDPFAYAFGSASAYVGRRPRWLSTDWVDDAVRAATAGEASDARAYAATFNVLDDDAVIALVEARMRRPDTDEDPLDSLVDAAPARVRAWLQSKARNGDGTTLGLPLAAAQVIMATIEGQEAAQGEWLLDWGRKSRNAWAVLRGVLLRELAAARFSEVVALCGGSAAHWRTTLERHRRAIADDADYAMRVAELTRAILRRAHPRRVATRE
jgi:REP element-mobilizing transposase RayT